MWLCSHWKFHFQLDYNDAVSNKNLFRNISKMVSVANWGLKVGWCSNRSRKDIPACKLLPTMKSATKLYTVYIVKMDVVNMPVKLATLCKQEFWNLFLLLLLHFCFKFQISSIYHFRDKSKYNFVHSFTHIHFFINIFETRMYNIICF